MFRFMMHPLTGVSGQITKRTRDLVAGFTTQPTLARLRNINRLMVTLDGIGFLRALDVLLVPGADEQCSRRDWTGNGRHATYPGGSYPNPSFSPLVGFKGSGGDGTGSEAAVGAHLVIPLQAAQAGRKAAPNLSMMGYFAYEAMTGVDGSFSGAYTECGYSGFSMRQQRATTVQPGQAWPARVLPNVPGPGANDIITAQLGHHTQMYWSGQFGAWYDGQIIYGAQLTQGAFSATGTENFRVLSRGSGAGPLGYTFHRIGLVYMGQPVTNEVLAQAHAAFLRYFSDCAAEAPPDVTAPTFLGTPALSVSEGQAFSYLLFANEPVSWGISGGADAAQFAIIDGNNLTMAPKSYGAPVDVGGNNVYEVQIRAEDTSGNVTLSNLSVTVTQTSIPGGGAMDFGTNENSGLIGAL
jgi:hypothetical protein